MALSLNRLGALILGINRQPLEKAQDDKFINGRLYNKLCEKFNVQNNKLFEIFREIIFFLQQGDESVKSITFLLSEQPNLSQPDNGILTFDQTLKRFQASENGRKYFDAFPREGCRVTNNTNITLVDSTFTALAFPFERFDPFNMHDTVTNNSRITIVRSGRYNFGGCAEFDVNAVGTRILQVTVNGGNPTVRISGTPDIGGAETVCLNVNADGEFVAGDYIELEAFQNSGGPLNVVALSDYSPDFWCCRIHDQPV